ncbi:MAG TPA: hypothetical protein VKA68_10425 [bacterium]|nr:hypothetical protein [bacterium]
MDDDTKRLDRFFWGGIIVGILVMFAGTAALMWRGVGTNEARLILCTGIGILFGAFGSTATIKYKGITITGVAAITIVLLYVIVNLTASQATFGAITGDIRGAQIDVRGDDNYLGAMRERSYDFVVDQGELRRPVFDVYIYFPPDAEGRGEKEIPFEGINTKYIESYLGSGRRMEWRYDQEQEVLVETISGDTMARLGLSLENFQAELPAKSTPWRTGSFFLNQAFAQDTPADVNKSMSDLRSGSHDIRRDAREKLAAAGPSAVTEMMTEWRASGDIYRVKLGVLVSLTKMLRGNKNLAPQVSDSLSADDLQLILETLNDPDRTIRVYAGEFLYDLGDPRIVQPALNMASGSDTSEEGIYLSLFVIKGAYPQLSESEKKRVTERLQSLRGDVGPKTKELIDSFFK